VNSPLTHSYDYLRSIIRPKSFITIFRNRMLEQTSFPWFRLITYIGVGAGYIFAIFTSRHLTFVGMTLLTVITLSWLGLFQFLFKEHLMSRLLVAGALAICACLSLLAAILAMGCDWLLLVVTAGVIMISSPLFFSFILSFVLWLDSALMVFVVNGHLDAAQFDLFAAFLFVLILAFTLRHLLQARTRTHRLIVTLARSKAELEAAHLQLQEYATQVEELSVTRERNRIAREIHDTLGHYLTQLAMQLEAATRMEELGDPGLSHELLEARRVAKECLTEVRRSVSTLRPEEITRGTFDAALRRLVSEYAQVHTDMQVSLDLEEATHQLNPLLCATLYRCAQEALTNIHKHAHATKVLLRLRTEEQQVELTVLDNGQGRISQADHPTGFGLLGMRERVELLGGRMQAAPEPGRGWRVVVTLPRRDEGEQVATRVALLTPLRES
jgi:signal transduction histidine kinase